MRLCGLWNKKDGNGNPHRSLKCKVLFMVPVCLVVLGIIVLGYFCPSGWCALTPGPELRNPGLQAALVLQPHSPPMHILDSLLSNKSLDEDVMNLGVTLPAQAPRKTVFPHEVLARNFKLDIEREDVIVFLHIQKTGGSVFGRHLIRNLDVGKPCRCQPGRKRCECVTKSDTNWLFSRYSTGWICGLHADWTELNNCVDDAMNRIEGVVRNRKYHYITMLRHPVHRFLSEWRHVQRGAAWKTARYHCNGRDATLEEVPFCYEGVNWRGVSLDEFIACPHNMARNRQVRMIANLSLVNCYNSTGMSVEERNYRILESAKENLLNMDFFGLTEFQVYSQQLFESTFGLQFYEDFVQFNVTRSSRVNITLDQLVKITRLNKVDMLFYDFAKDLFLQRYDLLKQQQSQTPSGSLHGNYTTPNPNNTETTNRSYAIPDHPPRRNISYHKPVRQFRQNG